MLVVSFGVGLARRAFVRVGFYAALAAWALLISEHGIKPLVQRTYDGELTFPSGNVTAVSATALAMWLALGPLLGRRSRHVTLVLGGEWVLLMSLAVVGAHWHTPLDAIGSVLLSVGVVTAGAAVFEPTWTPGPCEAMGRDLLGSGRQVAARCRTEFLPREMPEFTVAAGTAGHFGNEWAAERGNLSAGIPVANVVPPVRKTDVSSATPGPFHHTRDTIASAAASIPSISAIFLTEAAGFGIKSSLARSGLGASP